MLNRALQNKVKESLGNNFGDENFDHYRFRKKLNKKIKTSIQLKRFVWSILSKVSPRIAAKLYVNKIKSFLPKLEELYNLLGSESQVLIVNVLAYRLLGWHKVKINGQAMHYLTLMSQIELEHLSEEKIEVGFSEMILEHFSLRNINYSINLFTTKTSAIIDFEIEQYSLRRKGSGEICEISAIPGDTVLDIGACWGDTSLYFSHKVGVTGEVYAFEFIPSNLVVLQKNLSLNTTSISNIKIQFSPVSEKSNENLYYIDQGPASKVSSKEIPNQSGVAKSISIDDFILDNNIIKVDFIKMDIEGAELGALKGARQTITKFKPKLAIAVYHSLDDLVDIPKYLNSLELGYSFYLGHFTIHSEETILFAE